MTVLQSNQLGAVGHAQQHGAGRFRLVLCGQATQSGGVWEIAARLADCELVANSNRCECAELAADSTPTIVVMRASSPCCTLAPDRVGALFSNAVIIALCDDERDLSLWQSLVWDALPANPSETEAIEAVRLAGDEANRLVENIQMIEDYQLRRSSLTPNELQVLEAVCEGRLNKQIASELRVSVRTIEQRRRRVFEKMGVESAVPLAALTATVRTLAEQSKRCARRLSSAARKPVAPISNGVGMLTQHSVASGMVC